MVFFYMPIFIFMGYYLYDHFHSQNFRVHRWQKLALTFGLFCLEGVIIFQHEGMDKNFFFLLPFVTVYLVNACLRTSFLKTYDLQYLKQMSMSLYFSHPIFSSGLAMALAISRFLIQTEASWFLWWPWLEAISLDWPCSLITIGKKKGRIEVLTRKVSKETFFFILRKTDKTAKSCNSFRVLLWWKGLQVKSKRRRAWRKNGGMMLWFIKFIPRAF